MEIPLGVASKHNRKIRIEKPSIQTHADEILWRDVKKYLELIPSEPDPNFGRIEEIRDEIKSGSYLTSDKLEETAARLVIRFMRKE